MGHLITPFIVLNFFTLTQAQVHNFMITQENFWKIEIIEAVQNLVAVFIYSNKNANAFNLVENNQVIVRLKI